LQVEVAKLSEEIVENIKKLPFVSGISQEGNTLTIELKTRDDVRQQISQEITKSGGVIIAMNVKGQTLEEVFMQLVAKSSEGKAE